MRSFARPEASAWCRQRGLVVEATGIVRLSYDNGHPVGLEIPIPQHGGRMLALGYVLLMTGIEAESAFHGALVWLREWDIGSESFERVGWKLVQSLRQPTERRPIRKAPAQVFEVGEIVNAQTFLLLPMLFRWDAYFVPESADFFVRLGHDEQALVVARDRETFEQLSSRLEEGGWDPRERPAP